MRSRDRSLPLFSIGVTTYRRPAMLRECLGSILGQTFGDFEVIVGNDDPEGPLSMKALGIVDPRVRLLNYKRNVGPIRNANILLESSRSPYFTWLADDDMYAPTFLEAVDEALDACDDLCCVFTSYLHGKGLADGTGRSANVEVLSGRDFLGRYLSRRTRVVGCYGVFEAAYLRETGGMEHLGTAHFSLYPDNLLAIRAGLLDRVGYIDAPLVYFRTHDGSSSSATRDLGIYRSAQEDLCRQCLPILRSDSLRADFRPNVLRLLQWCVNDYATVVRRRGSIGGREAVAYGMFLGRNARALGASSECGEFVAFVIRTALDLVSQRFWRKKPNPVGLSAADV